MNNDDEVKKRIGAKIKARRLSKNLTQNTVASEINMDEKQLSRLESGKHYPTLKTLISLTRVLDMKLADFDDEYTPSNANFFKLVDILKTSTPEEIEKYLIIVKTIKGL